jgi:hypothetical protein
MHARTIGGKMFNFHSALKATALCAASLVAMPANAQQGRQQVAINRPILTGEGLNPAYVNLIRNEIEHTVTDNGGYLVFDMVRTDQMVKEIDRQNSGLFAADQIRDLAHYGVSYLITTDLMKYGDDFVLSGRLINVTTTQIMKSVDEIIPGLMKEGSNNPIDITTLKSETRKLTNAMLGGLGASDKSGSFGRVQEEATTMLRSFSGSGAWNDLKRSGYSISVDLRGVEPARVPHSDVLYSIRQGSPAVFRLLGPTGETISTYSMTFDTKPDTPNVLANKIAQKIGDEREKIVKALVKHKTD